MAFRSYLNTANQSQTFRLNATLHGDFSKDGGVVTAGIYLFHPAAFTDRLEASGVSAGQFLLRSVPFTTFTTPEGSSSLTSLFPRSAWIANSFVTVSTSFMNIDTPFFRRPVDVDVAIPVRSDYLTLAAQQTITVMFDVFTYSPIRGGVSFATTLVPDDNFFTDLDDNPVAGIVALGPSLAPPATPASLVLAPTTATSPAGTEHTVTVTATDGSGAPVANAIVFFSITSGPNSGFSAPNATDENGQASLTYLDVGAAGTDTIQAAIGDLQSNTVQVTWTAPGPLDRISISPENASIALGASQAYTAQGFDVFDNSRGDVTAETSFSIEPDGSCLGAVCTPAAAGLHLVTGNSGGKAATATLTVTEAQVTITFVAGNFGSITGTKIQTVNYGGSTSQVKAVPFLGFHFVNWTGTNGFIATTLNPLVVSNVTANQTVTANFAPNYVFIAFVAGAHGSITGNKIQLVPYGGSSSQVKAVPATGYHFVNWTGSNSFVATATNPLVVSNAAASQIIKANFAINQYTLNFSAGTGGTISGTTPQVVNFGSSATAVKAVPAAGYRFVNWTGTNSFVTTRVNPLTVKNVRASQSIKANFALR